MRTFLTGEWRDLAMLNWAVDAELLQSFVPRGTELDTFDGRTFVSLVGFRFVNTRVLGVPVPGHHDFEEVNLRIYVRRQVRDELRRAVTFIRELVPRPIIAAVARFTYNEPYLSAPMRHQLTGGGTDDAPRSAEYAWRLGRDWAGLRVNAGGASVKPAEGSEAEFITEHYWGYTRQRDGSTMEYRVEHPRWRVWTAATSGVFGDLTAVHGEEFARVLMQPATSGFIADGSAVRVGWPSRIRQE
jgi:uncharacterized protein YqjF (DUF2071 family)